MGINWPIEVDNHSVDGYVLEDAECNRLCRDELLEVARRANAYDQLVAALEEARKDINWMLNSRQFLNGHVFDYLDAALAATKGGA